MILVDANILMYAAGAAHPNKAPSIRFLEAVAEGTIDAALDAETLQEILHRYRHLGRWAEGHKLYNLARQIFSTILPITAEVLDTAVPILDSDPTFMAREALHAAAVKVHSMESICSYDRDFDRVKGLRRIEPQ